MRKIGDRLFGLMLWVLVPAAAMAQGITVSAATNETTLMKGERVALNVTVSGGDFRNIGRPLVPELPGLTLLSPQPSTSTSYSIVNGVSNRTYTYTYVYQADRVGRVNVPPIPVTVDGTTYQTAPFTLTVAEAAERESRSTDEVFVRLEVSDRSPVVGQQVITELVLYFKPEIEIRGFQVDPAWRADGFWSESLTDGSNPTAESVIVDGVRLRKAVLARHALFPNRAGDLTLSGREVDVTLRANVRYQDPFSTFFGGQRTEKIRTPDVRLQVRPLPAPGEGLDLNAVGRFRITRTVSNPEIVTGEAVEIVTRIDGSGNLALISRPEYALPDGFERYQPSEDLELRPGGGEVSGTRTFRDVWVARSAGTYRLEAAAIAVYDPVAGRHGTIALPAVDIVVSRDPSAGATSVAERPFVMAPVAANTPWVAVATPRVWALWWLWAAALVPVAAYVVARQQRARMDRLRTDHGYRRRVQARNRADAHLAAAEATTDVKAAYTALHAAVAGVIADRIGLPEAGQADAALVGALAGAGADPALTDAVAAFLEKCSTIRFAPVGTREDLARETGEVRALIIRILQATEA